MYFRTLGLILLMVTQLGYAQGRKPAVEDFVGIEIDTPETTPQGTEGLFNFEKDMDKFEENKGNAKLEKATPASEKSTNNLTTAAAVFLILGLPAIIWFLMMNHLRQKATVDNASNIEVLEKYRKERELKKAQEDQQKKAS